MNTTYSSPVRRRYLLILGVLGLTALFAPSIASVLVSLEWFGSLGYRQVYSTTLLTRIGLFVVCFLAFAVVLGMNAKKALSASADKPSFRMGREDGTEIAIEFPSWASKPIIAFLALVAGSSGAASWKTWLSFLHSSSFGINDPIFGRDIGFYVFKLPAYEALLSGVKWLVVLCFLMSVAIYLLTGVVRMTPDGPRAQRSARVHLTVLASLFIGIFAIESWVETAALLHSDLGPVAGASYADVHAKLPGLRLQIAVAVVAAILVAVSATRERVVLAGIGIGVLFLTNLLGVRVYSSIVHRFSVKPNEAVKEAPFIAHNIKATRAAYGLSVEERDLSGDLKLTLADIEANRDTIDNIRLWDHKELLDTFAQIQEIRTYYEFKSVDNDRYMIDGQLRQTMLSPRELLADSLPNRTWINERFTFTHGYGLTLGPVNQATKEGLPELYVKDIPPASSDGVPKVTRPGIYFGELSNSHVFVKTANKEFDRPSGDENVFAEYEGKAGVSLASLWNRALVAMHVGTYQVLLSDDLQAESRVLLYRNIRERAAKLAPFLDYDRDPYMVVRDNGQLVWVQDAYTKTNRYPYSEPMAASMNYVRNSVKVVIDAYDGTVDFYMSDNDDPILRTWRRIFPGMFKHEAQMPKDIQRHLRYPEDLFEIQTKMFSIYHMDDPQQVYNREDQWEVPAVGDSRLSPYYTIMKLPEEKSSEFILMIPFTPKSKQNLAAWMVGRNDGPQRGQLIVYRFPKDRLVFGPEQIMNRINQDAEISRQISLWDQRGSSAIFGTLLVIPVEESLIYVTPLYLRSSGGRIPELKRVVVVSENKIAMANNLDDAVVKIFGQSEKAPMVENIVDENKEPSGGPSAGALPAVAAVQPINDESTATVTGAKGAYDRAVAAQRRGDWAAYGEELKVLGDILSRLKADAN